MKNFTLALIFLLPLSLSAVTRTSVVNGMWSNPSTWSPAGVPAINDDVIINTAVQFNQDIALNGSLFHITSLGSLQDMGLDTIGFGGNLFLIEGYLSAAALAIGATDSTVNYGTITVDDLSQSGLMINHASGIICAGTQLATSDDFINNGSISAGMWINSGITTGTNGRFCVAGYFINSDAISGTIDICDATPGQPGDVNMGTIAGTVTYCQVGPCSQCTLMSVNDIAFSIEASIAPHPVTTAAVMEFSMPHEFVQGNNELLISDVTGRVVRIISFTGTQVVFDRTGLETGMYYYQVVNNNQALGYGKLLVE